MAKRRDAQSPVADDKTPSAAQETAACDGSSNKRRRVPPQSPQPEPQTGDGARALLNRTLVALLNDQLHTRPSGDWTALLAQYHVRLQEICSVFGAARDTEESSLISLSLPSFVTGDSTHDVDEELSNQEPNSEQSDAVTADAVAPTTPLAQPPAIEEDEDAAKDHHATETTKEETSSAPDLSPILDDLPASPNPFAGGFSHSLPLDEDEEDDAFSGQTVQFVTTRDGDDEMMAQTSLSFGMDCFLPVKRSFGIWNEPVLLQRRVPSDQLAVAKQISSGDFGDVFLGELSGQRVAVKRLCLSGQNKANALVFASEISVMSELSHPKIAAFVGVEWAREWEAQAVAEFVPHGDLRTLLESPDRATLTWADFKCRVVLDVLEALAYLHQRTPSVVMEVVKARNVLVSDTDGSSKLSVFAAARARSVADHNGGSVESTRWLAPEIIMAEPKTDRSTIYSFGVLLSELDTGKVPYCDAMDPDGSPMSSYKIAQLVASGKLQPSLSAECPEPIVALARQCWALEPTQRPTAASIGYKLLEILKNDL